MTGPVFNEPRFFGTVDTYSKSMQLTMATILLYVSSIPFTMSLSTLFSDEKVANNIGGLMIIVPVIILLQLLQTSSWTRILLYPMMLNPVTSACVLFIGIGRSSLVPAQFQVFSVDYISPSVAWAFLVAATPLWYACYIYLDQVMPDKYGIRRPCCFCLKNKRRELIKEYTQVGVEDALGPLANAATENENEVTHDSEDARQSSVYRESDPICIDGLSKHFGDLKAVNDLKFSIREGEVFTILGHNGAGKSTLIYMLTGVLKPSKGDAFVYGKKISQDILDIQ